MVLLGHCPQVQAEVVAAQLAQAEWLLGNPEMASGYARSEACFFVMGFVVCGLPAERRRVGVHGFHSLYAPQRVHSALYFRLAGFQFLETTHGYLYIRLK